LEDDDADERVKKGGKRRMEEGSGETGRNFGWPGEADVLGGVAARQLLF
jgi:hypothetical protein